MSSNEVDIQAHQDFLNETADQSALVGDIEPVEGLRPEYADNAGGRFLPGIDALARRYDSMRRVRRDGNCFFRAFIFALCEKLLPSEDNSKENAAMLKHLQQTIHNSKSALVDVGYEEVAFGDFWETFVDYLASMDSRSHAELVQDFQTVGGEAEYIVWYMRLLTAGYLKQHKEQFLPFIAGLFPGMDVDKFCTAEVEPVGKECDQPQIAALTEALGIGVRIEYLDGSTKEGDELQSYICSPNNDEWSGSRENVSINLLYRPGHYDVLYPKA